MEIGFAVLLLLASIMVVRQLFLFSVYNAAYIVNEGNVNIQTSAWLHMCATSGLVAASIYYGVVLL